MSITGFYDALSVKNWTENRLDAFQAYCAVQFEHNQETFMILVHTCIHVQLVYQGTMFFEQVYVPGRSFMYVTVSC